MPILVSYNTFYNIFNLKQKSRVTISTSLLLKNKTVQHRLILFQRTIHKLFYLKVGKTVMQQRVKEYELAIKLKQAGYFGVAYLLFRECLEDENLDRGSVLFNEALQLCESFNALPSADFLIECCNELMTLVEEEKVLFNECYPLKLNVQD